ncbi:ATP-binding protein [Chondromyces apiculatus]|nr:ATP-binding protein [Chondromyces apiculatus]
MHTQEFSAKSSAMARALGSSADQGWPFDLVFKNAPVGLAFLDCQHRFVAVNDLLAELHGCPPPEHIGRTLAEVAPGLWPAMALHIRQVMETGEPVLDADVRGESPPGSGQQRCCLASFLPIRNGSEIIGIGCALVDVGRVRTLHAAHEADEGLFASFSAESRHDPDAPEPSRRLSSPRILSLLGRASADLWAPSDVGAAARALARLLVPELADFCVVHLLNETGRPELIAAAHAIANGKERLEELDARYPALGEASAGALTPKASGYASTIRTGEPEILTHISEAGAEDGGRIARLQTLDASTVLTVPLRVQRHLIGAIELGRIGASRGYGSDDLHLAQDLAERAAIAIDRARLFTAAQRERARAEEGSRLKDEFLALVSHELRTPLTAILGWTRVLRTTTMTPDKENRALEIVERNARSQAQLIEDLLDIARIASGKLQIETAAVDLPLVVEGAIEAVRAPAAAKNLAIELAVEPSLGAVLGDAGRLQQVVWNLASNAVKFTPEGGRVQVSLVQHGDWVDLMVSDTGQGIREDLLPHVFEHFRQSDGPSGRPINGLGLGLAISRHLVELHGGTLVAESDGEGQGATFRVRLPVSRSPRRTAPAVIDDMTNSTTADAPSVRLTGVRVLVVDDSPDALDLLSAALEQAGAQVTAAANAAVALERIAQDHPDVLISDIAMPGRDGYALIRQLRTLPPEQGGRTPAVALTAHARAQDRTRALLEGFDLHAPKPIDPAELIAVVARLSGRIP